MASFQDCVKFATENPVCSFGTVEGDQPRTRFVALYSADKTGLYFQTEENKALCKQLRKNPKVEMSFVDKGLFNQSGGESHPPDMIVQMRVTGQVEFLDDLKLKAKMIKDRPYLAGVGITKPDHPLMVAFRISKGEAFFWRMMDSTRETAIPRIKF